MAFRGFASGRRLKSSVVLLAAVAGVGPVAGRALAATFTYTPTAGTTDQWAAGTNWNSVPVSAADTELTFVGTNTTVLANGLANTNTNNISGAFQLNILDLQGTGPASGAATITLASASPSTGLNFVANGGTNPVVNLNAVNGAAAVSYVVSQPVALGNDLTFQGAGTSVFNFNGVISGSALVTKSGASALNLGGANTFSGGFVLSSTGGTANVVRVGVASAGTAGSITSGAFGTGTLAVNGGFLSSDSTTARTILNPVTFGGDATLGSTVNTGALAFSGAGTLNGNRTLTINTGVTLGGNLGELGGSFALTKAGAGTLTLSGSNTYTGGTTINAGIAQFNSNGAVGGTGANVTVAAAATAAAGFAIDQTFLNRITTTSAGTAALAVASANNLDFSAYPNLTLGATAASTYTGTITPNGGTYRLGGGGSTLTLSNTNALTGANAVSLPSTSGGTVVLSAANDFTGATSVGAATALRLSNSNAIAGTSGVTVTAGGNVQLASGVTITGKTITVNGTAGQGALETNATGSNTSTWAGPVVVGSDAARLGTSAGATGTLIIGGSITSPGGAFAPAIRTDNTAGSTVRFAAANSYTGTNTQIVVGVLQLAAAGAMPSTTGITMGNNAGQGFATFDLNGTSAQIIGLATVTGDNIATTVTSATAAVLTINNSAAFTFGNTTRGTISGALAIAKSGAGTQTLIGPAANTYTGGTTITGGSLAAGSNGVLGTGNVSVAPAAAASSTLDLSAIALTAAGGGAVSDSATLTLSSTGGNFGRVAFGTSTLNETVGNLIVDGVTQPAGTYTQANLANFITGSGSITTLAVPEPASAGLLGLAAAGLLARRRHGRRRP